MPSDYIPRKLDHGIRKKKVMQRLARKTDREIPETQHLHNIGRIFIAAPNTPNGEIQESFRVLSTRRTIQQEKPAVFLNPTGISVGS